MRSSVAQGAVVGILAAVLSTSCSRIADAPDDPIDFEALKIEACTSACATMDTCDPDRFVGMEPESCFERCMTLMPMLHEENQCGSREIIHLECIGELDCEGFEAFENGHFPTPDYSVPCVAEFDHTIPCDENAPFDLDEPRPTHRSE